MKGLLYLVIVLFAVSCTRAVYIPAIRTQISNDVYKYAVANQFLTV